MLPYQERPIEIATLLNPAFGALLIALAVQSYNTQSHREISLSELYLILPLVLHEEMRSLLPGKSTVSIVTWTETNPEALAGLAERVTYLIPFTQEAIRFALRHQAIVRSSPAGFRPGDHIPTRQSIRHTLLSDEVRDCVAKSSHVGRWFARAGSAETVLAAWRVSP